MKIRLRQCLAAHVVAVLVLATASCSDPSALPTDHPPIADVLSRVNVNPGALVLAVGDRMQIQVSAQNIFGEPIPMGTGIPVVWKSSAPKTISVDSNGLVLAHKATAEDESINITASWTYNGVTLTGTTSATVTTLRDPIAAIRIIPTDSAQSGWSDRLELVPVNGVSSYLAAGASVYTVDANEVPLATQTIVLTVRDLARKNSIYLLRYGKLGLSWGIGQYQVMSHSVGPFWIYAEATVYGVPMRDSLRWTGLYPVTGLVPIARDSASGAFLSTMSGEEVFVQPCGLVRFQNTTNVPLDIVFDDSTTTKCIPTDEDGNIRNLAATKTATRKFPATGTIQWSVRDPATGTMLPRLSGKITMKVP